MLENTVTPARPVVVNGLGGGRVFIDELPKCGERWVRSRKLKVLSAIDGGMLTIEEASIRYALSPEEIQTWRKRYLEKGTDGLLLLKQNPDLIVPPGRRRNWRPILLVEPEIRFDGVVVDPPAQRVVFGDRAMRLTSLEMMVFIMLAKKPGDFVEKKEFISKLWEAADAKPQFKTIDVVICSIRKKMRVTIGNDLIETSWGRGYRLAVAA